MSGGNDYQLVLMSNYSYPRHLMQTAWDVWI